MCRRMLFARDETGDGVLDDGSGLIRDGLSDDLHEAGELSYLRAEGFWGKSLHYLNEARAECGIARD